MYIKDLEWTNVSVNQRKIFFIFLIFNQNIIILLCPSYTLHVPAVISLRLQGKLSFPYNCQKMNGQIYVLLC